MDSPHGVSAFCFQSACTPIRSTVPEGRTSSVHSRLLKSPLQSSYAFIPVRALASPNSPARVPSLIATSPKRVYNSRSIPTLRYAPSSGFLNLSTVSSAFWLAGLFHPAATSRVQPVQGLLPLRSHPSSSEGACPLAVSEPPLTHRNELPRSAASTSRLFSAPRCVPTLRGLAAIPVAPFLRFLLLQVLRLLAVALVLPEGFRSCRFEICLRLRAGQLRSASACCQRGARLVCFQTADLLELFEPSWFSCPNRLGSCAFMINKIGRAHV